MNAFWQRITPSRDVVAAADRKSTRLNSSHSQISYAVFCLKKKKVVDHVVDVPLVARDFEAYAIVGRLVAATCDSDLEVRARHPANLSPFSGLGLVAVDAPE